jgi:hypothetical protein
LLNQFQNSVAKPGIETLVFNLLSKFLYWMDGILIGFLIVYVLQASVGAADVDSVTGFSGGGSTRTAGQTAITRYASPWYVSPFFYLI